MRPSRSLKLALFAAALLAVGALFALRLRPRLAAGEEIFWLAELWPLAAVYCIGLVTCLDWLLREPPAPARRAPRRGRRA